MNNQKDINEQEVVIHVQDVKKNFKSYLDKASSFKERFINPSRGKHEDVQVLKGISFDVHKGEAIGLIGKNGCGKSTTLKLLTRILYPNEGKIEIKGRVSSLIELGAGFHPDMSGRENIYTNASIFGIKRKEVDERLGDIIRFSELEEYIDQPVRTYSSGMYMRLAFAVAINVDADVLLIDEILAVGDSAFQKKCFERLQEIKAKGTTIVIVSHSMDQMYKICDRLIWIESGLIKDEGVPKFIGEAYLAAMEGRRLDRIEWENQQKKEELDKQIQAEQERLRKEQEKEQKRQEEKRLKEEEQKQKEEEEKKRREVLAAMEQKKREIERNATLKMVTKNCRPDARRTGNGMVQISSVTLKNMREETVDILVTGDKYKFEITLDNKGNISDVTLAIGFTRDDGVYCYGTFIVLDKMQRKLEGGKIIFEFTNDLLAGKYFVDFFVQSGQQEMYDQINNLLLFEVEKGDTKQRGIVNLKNKWE